MAFTGTPIITQISDRKARITGVALAGAATGTISFSGGSGQVTLPAAFQPHEYTYEGDTITLADSIEVTTRNAATGIATPVPIAIVKQGTNPTDFLVQITNLTGGTTSPLQEIYVEFH